MFISNKVENKYNYTVTDGCLLIRADTAREVYEHCKAQFFNHFVAEHGDALIEISCKIEDACKTRNTSIILSGKDLFELFGSGGDDIYGHTDKSISRTTLYDLVDVCEMVGYSTTLRIDDALDPCDSLDNKCTDYFSLDIRWV